MAFRVIKQTMECTFEQFIEETKVLLRETNLPSEDVEEQLRLYSGMQALRVVFKDLSDRRREYALELKTMCEEVVYSNYLTIKSKAAAVFTAVVKVELHKANIPERLRPRTEEIKNYDSRIQRELRKADTFLKQMEQKLKQIAEDETSILTEGPIKLLKMTYIDFETCLNKASDHLQNADQAFASLKDDAKTYLLEKFGITVAAAASAAAAGSVIGYGVGLATNAVGVAVNCSRMAGVGAAAGGSPVALKELYYAYGEYKKCTNHCKELETKMNSLKADRMESERDSEGIKKKVALF